MKSKFNMITAEYALMPMHTHPGLGSIHYQHSRMCFYDRISRSTETDMHRSCIEGAALWHILERASQVIMTRIQHHV